jgi:hypothetical protein
LRLPQSSSISRVWEGKAERSQRANAYHGRVITGAPAWSKHRVAQCGREVLRVGGSIEPDFLPHRARLVIRYLHFSFLHSIFFDPDFLTYFFNPGISI